MTERPAALLAMCRPDYFDVSYSINPWMNPSNWQSHSTDLFEQAQTGWENMCQTFLSLGVSIQLVPPVAKLPDMVFTANAAIVLDKKVLLAHFKHKERQGEETPFAQFFSDMKEQGVIDDVKVLPKEIFQEGAGDCHWDSHRQLFWAGYGPRSSKEAIPIISDYFGKEVIALELASDRYYHVDVSLCPLTRGQLIYYPTAFTKQSLAKIQERVPKDQLIAIDAEDANSFSANSVNLDDKIIMAHCSNKLEAQLKEYGYSVITVPVETFALSGGSVFCMTLRLDWYSGS